MEIASVGKKCVIDAKAQPIMNTACALFLKSARNEGTL